MVPLLGQMVAGASVSLPLGLNLVSYFARSRLAWSGFALRPLLLGSALVGLRGACFLLLFSAVGFVLVRGGSLGWMSDALAGLAQVSDIQFRRKWKLDSID